MSRPDLCFDTSSLRNSLSSLCRLSIASSTVKRGRTPRNSATSPRHGFKSRTIVGRFDNRASSTAQFTETVVVPAPPLAPRNTWVAQGWRVPAWAASRRAAVFRTAPWKDSSIERLACVCPPVVHGKNSLAPARIAPRIRSDSAVMATAKMAIDAWVARSRSIAAMPEAASARRSTTATSGCEPSVARPSTIPTGTPHARSSVAAWRLKSSSWLTMSAVSCAMSILFRYPNRSVERRAAQRGSDPGNRMATPVPRLSVLDSPRNSL